MMTSLSATKIAVRRQDYLGIIILFAASGASGLMLEVVWSRMLGWLLGATTWSVMTVLIAFMGGLGLGGILWGRWAGSFRAPVAALRSHGDRDRSVQPRRADPVRGAGRLLRGGHTS